MQDFKLNIHISKQSLQHCAWVASPTKGRACEHHRVAPPQNMTVMRGKEMIHPYCIHILINAPESQGSRGQEAFFSVSRSPPPGPGLLLEMKVYQTPRNIQFPNCSMGISRI